MNELIFANVSAFASPTRSLREPLQVWLTVCGSVPNPVIEVVSKAIAKRYGDGICTPLGVINFGARIIRIGTNSGNLKSRKERNAFLITDSV